MTGHHMYQRHTGRGHRDIIEWIDSVAAAGNQRLKKHKMGMEFFTCLPFMIVNKCACLYTLSSLENKLYV